MRVVRAPMRFLAGLLVFVLLASCGSGGQPGPFVAPPEITAVFAPGPIVYAVEAEIAVALADVDLDMLESVEFIVRTKSGLASRDVHVTYERTYFDRTGDLDVPGGLLRFPVFGLYADFDNSVTIRLGLVGGASIEKDFVVPTAAAPDPTRFAQVVVDAVDPTLDAGFLLLQTRDGPTVVDIDGQVRWASPLVGEAVFPRLPVRDGLLLGATNSGALYRCDWLGRTAMSTMSDPRLIASHHNFSPGKTGILNTVSVDEGALRRPLSVLVEMTETGASLREWNFDQIFSDTITAGSEDPSGFVLEGGNWFHMNAAIYDGSDDSVIASSRHNFVVKADHATGAIKWILGDPSRKWYTNYPNSLQPLALDVTGDAPIGQHALSITADGQYLLLFNNGLAALGPVPDGESRTYSKVSLYRIDETARTAEEVWSYDRGQGVYSTVCSSACPTANGDVLVVFAAPDDASDPLIVIVNDAGTTLFEARVLGSGCMAIYGAEEIRFQGLVLD